MHTVDNLQGGNNAVTEESNIALGANVAGAVIAAPSSILIHLDNTKAGMSRVDKAQVEKIINDVSQGSPFYVNEQRKATLRRKKVDAMRAKSAAFDKADPAHIIRRVDAHADRLLSRGDQLLGVFVHVDMDMFFAAVEEKRDPKLKSVPFGVGGMGMLSTTNYLAREYGVRAGMPGYIGKRLCPHLVFANSSYEVYREESAVVHSIVKEYDPDYRSGGLDELTMNLLPYLQRNPKRALVDPAELEGNDRRAAERPPAIASLLIEAAAVAEEIRSRIFQQTQLTASCGIAPTACLAKIVANYNKPNGQYVVHASTHKEVMELVHALPIRAIPGIGKVAEEVLTQSFHIQTCADLFAHRYRLCFCVTPKFFAFLLEIGLGVMGAFGGGVAAAGEDTAPADDAGDDDSDEQNKRGLPRQLPSAAGAVDRKSIGHERTFRPKLFAEELIAVAEKTLRLSHATLCEEGLLTKQVGLKLKYKTFEVRQCAATLSVPTEDIDVLHEALMQLLAPFVDEFYSFRLLGVRLAALSARPAGYDRLLAPRAVVLCAAPHSPPSGRRLRGGGGTDTKQPLVTLDSLFAAAAAGATKKRSRDDIQHQSEEDCDDDDVIVLGSSSVAKSSSTSVGRRPKAKQSSKLHHAIAQHMPEVYTSDDTPLLSPDADQGNEEEEEDDLIVCGAPQASAVPHDSRVWRRGVAPPAPNGAAGSKAMSPDEPPLIVACGHVSTTAADLLSTRSSSSVCVLSPPTGGAEVGSASVHPKISTNTDGAFVYVIDD